MAVVVLSARVVSYLLYPNGDPRYTAVLYVMVPVALVIAISAELFDRASLRTARLAANSPTGADALRQDSVTTH